MAKFFQGTSKIEKTTGITNWIYFALTPMIVMFFLLNGVSECRAVDFCAVSIFFMVFMGSLLTLIALWALSPGVRASLRGKGNVLVFFNVDVNLRNLVWIPFGLVLVLGIAFGLQNVEHPTTPFISIFLSGLVIGVALLRTHSAIIPILIHALYNIIVVLLSGQFSGFETTNLPIFIPEVGFNVQLLGALGSEIVFQGVLVAPSEELFRILVIAFVVVASKAKFINEGKPVWAGMIIANVLWTVYHGIALV